MMNDFFQVVRMFLLDYLPRQRCLSENTISSYRQTLNLFVTYLREKNGLSVLQIKFSVIEKEIILSFLNWLETDRHCSASTRNQRLMALRSFFDYAGQLDCTQTALYLAVQSIPSKSTVGKTVDFLTEPALSALLMQPDPSKTKELRNLVFMILMYDTAARCGELLQLKLRDIHLDRQHPVVYFTGKGQKTRVVPLMSKTVQHCKNYWNKFHPDERTNSERTFFYTTSHGIQHPMSADTVAVFLKKYGAMAAQVCSEVPDHVHPHMLRHTRAMHLYQQGMPIVLLSDYLGHSSVETTRIYAYADTEMKRAALEKADAINKIAPSSDADWTIDEDTILKLSGLL